MQLTIIILDDWHKILYLNKMPLLTKTTYSKNEVTTWPVPNYWDIIALVLVFFGVVVLGWSVKQMVAPYQLGDVINISLNPINLPMYALRTVLRLFVALFFSLVFTFTVGTWAAKNKHAERLIIPMIDVLQSVPVLSFLALALPGFFLIFKNSMLGPECAAIFCIFTGQVWNMVLSFYQGVKTVPNNLKEVASLLRLSTWQKFWRVEVPFAMPGLLWNMMMSMSGSWVFVVACEALTTSNQTITLPGIGSYIYLAISQTNTHALIYAVLSVIIIIFLYDQLLFRPLIYWTCKFKESQNEDGDEKMPRVWLINLFQRTRFLRRAGIWFSAIGDFFVNFGLFQTKIKNKPLISARTSKLIVWLYYSILVIISVSALIFIGRFIFTTITLNEAGHIMLSGIYTAIRVASLIFLSSLIWVPIGVWIGLRPSAVAVVQPIIQFVAAFPANTVFSVAAMLMITFDLNIETWSAPLMVLGTQWYILFNVIAGASTISKELKFAAANFKVTGLLWWRRLILPGIAPYLITGAITAAGGAWNASILAEVIHWGSITLRATGLGSYIEQNSAKGDLPRVICGTIFMCIIVFLINRIFWRPLYDIAVKKFQDDI